MSRDQSRWQKLIAAVLVSCFVACLAACAPQSNDIGTSESSGTDVTNAVEPAGDEANETVSVEPADDEGDTASEPAGNETADVDEPATSEPAVIETPAAENSAEVEPSGEEAAPAEFVWSVETDCTMCHATQVASFGNEECAASLHSALACTVCHTDIEGMEKGHKRVELTDTDGAENLRRSDFDSTVCLACHDLTALADATASSTVLTDNNGTVVNPHALSESDSHSRVTCASCHQVHASGPVATVAYETCTNCHHHGVFECGTCHQ